MKHIPSFFTKAATPSKRRFISLLGIALLASPALSSPIPKFSQTGLEGWKSESFKGTTDYKIIELSGQEVLYAKTQNAASGYGWEGKVDVNTTPWIHWCWRISNTYTDLDERTKAGDDYPARIYVVAKTGFLPFQVQALNYVWSSSLPIGTDWPNAFTSRAHLLALRSVEDPTLQWLPESRNLLDDFKRYFNNSDPNITAVALMSDSDNAGQAAEAWFSDMIVSSSNEHPGCPL